MLKFEMMNEYLVNHFPELENEIEEIFYEGIPTYIFFESVINGKLKDLTQTSHIDYDYAP